MKKILLLLTVMMGTLTAYADEPAYPFLTFETTDGVTASVPVGSFHIVVDGTTLTAGDKTFTLTNLNKMYFTATDMTSGISPIAVTDWSDITEVYDLNGRRVSREQMQSGVYIVKTKQGTYKLIAR